MNFYSQIVKKGDAKTVKVRFLDDWVIQEKCLNESYLNFLAERGPVIEFYSDCGTNFTGTDNELQKEIQKIDPEVLKIEFTTTYTSWLFNPPESKHMGGSWERLIRSVKSGIDQIMPTRTPKEEMLRNLMKQIQNVVNSRPLTYIPLDNEEDEALTPNHFIKLSSNGFKPPCEIDLDGPYLKKSWKESQRLTELFWKRFVKEYLPMLARRTKWFKPVNPLKREDLVLVMDDDNPRNTYPKARIIDTQTGSNGQVRRVKVEMIVDAKMTDERRISKLVADLFPNQSIKKTVYSDLETAISQKAEEAGLVYHPPWVLKLI